MPRCTQGSWINVIPWWSCKIGGRYHLKDLDLLVLYAGELIICPPFPCLRVHNLTSQSVNNLSTSFLHYTNRGFRGFGGKIVSASWCATCPPWTLLLSFCVYPNFEAASLLQSMLLVLVHVSLFWGCDWQKIPRDIGFFCCRRDAFKSHCLGVVKGHNTNLHNFVWGLGKMGY